MMDDNAVNNDDNNDKPEHENNESPQVEPENKPPDEATPAEKTNLVIIKSNTDIADNPFVNVPEISSVTGVKLDDAEDVYRRKGYYYALHLPSAKPDEALPLLLGDHVTNINARISQSAKRFEEARINITGQIVYWQKQLAEKETFKEEYRAAVEKKIADCEELQKKIDHELQELGNLSKQIGKEKEEIIDKRISNLKKEINGIIEIYQEVEDKQNKKFDDEFTKNRTYFQSRIKSLTALKDECYEALADVKSRIKALNQVGINVPVANILITIGLICAFIAGWFFSTWAGNDEKMTPGTMGNNSNLRFFIIDSLAKLTANHTWLELLAGLFTYILIIALVSYACSKLSYRQKLLASKRKKIAGKPSTEENDQKEEIVFDMEEEDQLMKASFKANDWYGFWLKVTPFIVFGFLTLVVLAWGIYHPGPPGSSNELQELMDSYSNQALGSFIALLLAGLAILYIARVVEPKFVKQLQEKGSIKATGSIEILAAILLFFGMIVLMVLYKVDGNMGHRIGVIALAGFIVSCFSTGLILGYGYRFRALQDLALMLEYDLEVYEYRLYQLQSPYRVSYLKFNQFHVNMHAIQLTMQHLVQNRNVTATSLTSGQPNEKPAESQPPVNTNAENKKEPGRLLVWYKDGKAYIAGIWNKFVNRQKQAPAPKTDPMLNIISDTESLYFPVHAKQVDLIYRKIQMLLEKIRSIEEEAATMYRNEKVFQSLNDQAEAIQQKIYKLKKQRTDMQKKEDEERIKILLLGEKEKNLLSEGFFTGLWQKKELQ